MTIQKQRNRAASDTAGAGVALWRVIADEIERDVVHGRYGTGGRLPAENEIAAMFDVNRHTVRRAIAALTARGILRAERGSGTFVENGRIAYRIGKRTRFSENVSAAGRQADGRLISASIEAADIEIGLRLQLDPGTAVVRLDVIRHANRVPLCVGTSWLEERRFPNAHKIFASARSMTVLLRHFGIADYVRATTSISAARADAADAARLSLTPGAPVLLVDSVDTERAGRPIVTTRARFAADRVELTVGG